MPALFVAVDGNDDPAQRLATARHKNARVISGRTGVQDGQKKGRLTSDRLASNAVDIGTVDTEVLQFARTHAAKFGNGLTVLAPVVEGACYVHDGPLS